MGSEPPRGPAEDIARAAEAIARADGLVVAAGAGMGVDSGLPDFRGPEGFWRAYPAYAKLGLRFEALANPRWFARDPTLAWGFYGHRLGLYRRTAPHEGFAVVQRLAATLRHGLFAVTSNVDGHFQRAGVPAERVAEVHGSIEHLQCTAGCGPAWPVPDDLVVDVDEATGRARPPLPTCPRCARLARPNILMFGDGEWDDARSAAQGARLGAWLEVVGRDRLVVLECGAGRAVPTIRFFSEGLVRTRGATLVRVNPREPEVPAGQIGLALGARQAILAIQGKIG